LPKQSYKTLQQLVWLSQAERCDSILYVLAVSGLEDSEGPFLPERDPEEDSMAYEFRKYKSNYYFTKMSLQATE